MKSYANVFLPFLKRYGLNADYDRLHELVYHQDTLCQMLGHNDWTDKTAYELQSIKDNVRLLTPELLDRINHEVVLAGHTLVKKNDQDNLLPLMARGDSFVVETNVHFPADFIQLYDVIRKAIEVCAKLSERQKSSQWRQFGYNIRCIKRKLRVVHQLKRSTSKKPEKKALKDQQIKLAHRDYLDAVDFQLQRAVSTGAELGCFNPRLLSQLNHYIAHAEVQMGQIRRRLFNQEIIPHEEKVFSIFQPHTEWVGKGKAGVPVEFGLRVCIIEDQYRFILHHQVMEKVTDSDIA